MSGENSGKSFVLTDESLNSSGFWILTKGGDLKQFKKNPVMLWSHMRVWKGTEDEVLPIGRWENVRISDDGALIADAVFDENDPFAVKIKNKVENGFLKAASVGIRVIETSSDTKYKKHGQTRETITKWKLVEASICDIGRNENALVFYDENDNVLELSGDSEVNCPIKKLTIDNGQLTMKEESTETTGSTEVDKNEGVKDTNIINILKMEKLTKLLNLADGSQEQEIVASVQAIIGERDALKAEKDARNAQLAAERQTEAETLTDAAIRDGRVNDDEKHSVRTSWIGFFEQNFDGAKNALAGIPVPKSVKEQMQEQQSEQPAGSAWAKRQAEIEGGVKS